MHRRPKTNFVRCIGKFTCSKLGKDEIGKDPVWVEWKLELTKTTSNKWDKTSVKTMMSWIDMNYWFSFCHVQVMINVVNIQIIWCSNILNSIV